MLCVSRQRISRSDSSILKGKEKRITCKPTRDATVAVGLGLGALSTREGCYRRAYAKRNHQTIEGRTETILRPPRPQSSYPKNPLPHHLA